MYMYLCLFSENKEPKLQEARVFGTVFGNKSINNNNYSESEDINSDNDDNSDINDTDNNNNNNSNDNSTDFHADANIFVNKDEYEYTTGEEQENTIHRVCAYIHIYM